MKKLINEFKEFALNGNMFDMAIGVIMGSAVKGVVTSIVENLITPFITAFTGGGTTTFANNVFVLNGAEIKYGLFISTFVDFLITAFIIFMMVKVLNKVRILNKNEEVKEEVKEPEISSTDKLLMEILEELKKEK